MQEIPRQEEYHTEPKRYGMGDPVLMRKNFKPKSWVKRNDKELQRIFLEEIARTVSLEKNIPQEIRGDLLLESNYRKEIKLAHQNSIEVTKISKN
jgi:hypothetical protein